MNEKKLQMLFLHLFSAKYLFVFMPVYLFIYYFSHFSDLSFFYDFLLFHNFLDTSFSYFFFINFESFFLKFTYGQWRGGRSATTISRPSHILLIFSSEPPRNPRPSISFQFLKIKLFSKNLVTLGHKIWMK